MIVSCGLSSIEVEECNKKLSRKRHLIQFSRNKQFDHPLIFINNIVKNLMSVWGPTKISTDANKRDSYCPLLFQKILRNYQPVTSVKPSQPVANLKKSSSRQETKNNEPQKVLIDLNKKVKLVRGRSNEENKENVQDNGATHYELSSSLNKKHSDILSSYDQLREQVEEKFLDIQEFIFQQKSETIFQPLLAQTNNQKNSELQQEQLKPDHPQEGQEYCCQMITQNNELPEIMMPFKVLSKCQFLNEPRFDRVESCLEEQNIEINSNKEQEKSHPLHLKTKISLRILKKKLRNHSISEVVQDLLKHRRIQFDDLYSLPEKQIICEALLSLMKNELIQ